jgi:crotonobetaine/carnitine-CoA ligase
LTKQAERFGDRRLFVCGATTWSYRETKNAAAAAAGMLLDAGLAAADRVALMCGNRAEFMTVFLGAAWIGVITVPVNTAAKGPQVSYYLKNSGARILIVEARFLDVIEQADLAGLPLERIWVIGDPRRRPCKACHAACCRRQERPYRPRRSSRAMFLRSCTPRARPGHQKA